jgi:hypothetical protein
MRVAASCTLQVIQLSQLVSARRARRSSARLSIAASSRARDFSLSRNDLTNLAREVCVSLSALRLRRASRLIFLASSPRARTLQALHVQIPL